MLPSITETITIAPNETLIAKLSINGSRRNIGTHECDSPKIKAKIAGHENFAAQKFKDIHRMQFPGNQALNYQC